MNNSNLLDQAGILLCRVYKHWKIYTYTKPVKISWQLLRPIFVNIKSIPSFSHQYPIFTFLNGTKWTIQICWIKQEYYYTAAGFPNIERLTQYRYIPASLWKYHGNYSNQTNFCKYIKHFISLQLRWCPIFTCNG